MTPDFILALVRTILQMGGVLVASRPDLVTPDAWSAFTSEVIQLVSAGIAASSFLWMTWERVNTKVVVSK